MTKYKQIETTKRFEKDVLLMKKRRKNFFKFKNVLNMLAQEQELTPKYKNHKLRGNFVNHWECHIEPDWLLIYRNENEKLILVRTGTHSDLFD